MASDDPNPAAQQKRNLEQMRKQGERAIMGVCRGRRFGSAGIACFGGVEDPQEDKRRRIAQSSEEEEMRRLEEGTSAAGRVGTGEPGGVGCSQAQPAVSTAVSNGQGSKSLLDSETMSNLASSRRLVRANHLPLPNGLGSLAAYGSDSEDDS